MSISSIPSLPNIPAPALNDKKNNPESGEKSKTVEDQSKDNDSASSSSQLSTSQNKKDGNSAHPKKLKPPSVRPKLTARQRSISNPVIIRPATPTTNTSIATNDHSSLAKMQSKPMKTAPKPLTTEQQLASDLADLLEKTRLHKQIRLDDEISLSQATINLQRHYGKQADVKVRVDALITNLFGNDVKKSEAWD
ncbi:MAG: hypothetical protein ACK5D0_08595, partial [Burkholderiaceae bacterium]